MGLTPEGGLTPDQFQRLFGALDQWLVRRMGELEAPLELLVVGGAAISMQWDPGRVTSDVDLVSDRLPGDLWEGAAEVAAGQEGVRPDWLNDAAKIGALSPRVDCRTHPRIRRERTCWFMGPSARYVMAMKLVAGRPRWIWMTYQPC